MKVNHLLMKLTNLQKEINLIKKELFLDSDRYQIIAIRRDGFSFVGCNDHLNNDDHIMINASEKVDSDLIKRAIQFYFNRLNQHHGSLVDVYSDIDKDDLDENFRKLIDVLDMKYHYDVDDRLVELIRTEYAEDHSREEL